MATTAAPVAGANGESPFGIGRLFLADSRLAYLVLNEVRHRCLHAVFGSTREQDNVLTFVVAAGAATVTYEGAQRVMRTPLHVTGTDAGIGAVVLREAAMSVAGAKARTTPMFGSLVAFAVVGGLALPGLRRAAHALRLAEQGARENRIARYLEVTRADVRPGADAQS